MKAILGSIVLVSCLFVSGQAMAQNGEVQEYKFQSMYSGPHILNRAMYQPDIEEINKDAKLGMILQYLPSGEIVKSDDSLPALMNGTIDMGGVGPQYQATLFPHTMAFTVPYIAEDSVQASALYWKAYTEIPEVKVEWDNKIKVLTVWGSDRSGLFSKVGPIKSPQDIKGKTVLIWSGSQVPQVRAWGGVPVIVTSNDTFMSMKRGVGDIFFGPLPVGVAYNLMEVAKDITVLPATTLFLVNGVNWDVWDSLTKAQQDILMAKFGGEEASIKSGRLLYDATNKDMETMKSNGCTINYPDEAQLKAFRDSDYFRTMYFWAEDLKRLGNPDPSSAIQRAYDMAATVAGGAQ